VQNFRAPFHCTFFEKITITTCNIYFFFSLKKQQFEHNNVIEKNKNLQKKLQEMLPENLKDLLGDESKILYKICVFLFIRLSRIIKKKINMKGCPKKICPHGKKCCSALQSIAMDTHDFFQEIPEIDLRIFSFQFSFSYKAYCRTQCKN
jgi:hypothetical protein